MDIPADWLSEAQLAAAFTVPADGRSALHNKLRNWRRRGLLLRRYGSLPVPASRNLGIGVGNEAVYPPVTLPMLRLIFKLREEGRRLDECLWQLWLAGYPADIVGWTVRALRRIEVGVKEELASSSDDNALRKKVTRKPDKRTDPRRPFYSKTKWGEWYGFMEYPLAILLGSRPSDKLFERFASALSLFTGPADMSPARIAEEFSFDALSRILSDASAAELELAREDCQTIAWAAENPNTGVSFILEGVWKYLPCRAMSLPLMIGVRRFYNSTQSLAEILFPEGEPITFAVPYDMPSVSDPASPRVSPQ